VKGGRPIAREQDGSNSNDVTLRGETASPRGPVQAAHVKFAIDGDGLSVSVEVPVQIALGAAKDAAERAAKEKLKRFLREAVNQMGSL
jgi:hypothetical protein